MARTPTDPTKAQVWVTKGLDDLDFEFYIPNGPKGDPGGITYATDLGATNLNAIVTTGVYRTSGTSTLLATENYPVNLAGVLVVYERLRDASFQSVFQEYYVADSVNGARVKYVRYMYGVTNWTPWRAYVSTRIDQTAGRAIYQWDDVNRRDQLVYGDTGWRDISSLILNGHTGSVHVRRTAQLVYVRMNITPNQANTSADIFNWPSGFAPDVSNLWVSTRPTAATSTVHLNVNSTRIVINGPAAFTAGWGSVSYEAVFPALNTWPTALPGTASSTIPNL